MCSSRISPKSSLHKPTLAQLIQTTSSTTTGNDTTPTPKKPDPGDSQANDDEKKEGQPKKKPRTGKVNEGDLRSALLSQLAGNTGEAEVGTD